MGSVTLTRRLSWLALSLLAVTAAEPVLGAGLRVFEKESAAGFESNWWLVDVLFYVAGGFLLLLGLYKWKRGWKKSQGRSLMVAVAAGSAGVAMIFFIAEPALAKDLGDMARKSATALESFPLVVQILFYVVGGFLVLMGLYKFKRMQDNPQQQSFMGAVVTGLVGVAMLFFPSAITMLGGTLDLSPGGTIQRPKMQ